MRLDAFMAAANAGYYANHDPFADFTTSPEITQVFGEILGLWAAVAWEGMGRPDPVLLAEAGPGRGTLMVDALRAVRRVAPAFHAALRLHLVEISPRLRAIQAEALPGATWHDRIEELPPGPLLLLANEFLDALPIRQFVRRGDGWTERHVEEGRWVEKPLPLLPLGEGRGEGWTPLGSSNLGGGSPKPEASPTLTQPSPNGRGLFAPDLLAGEGQVVEVNQPARAIAAHLAARAAAHPLAALFLDYGPARSAPGDSLQALCAGRPADPLVEPGEADLTAHVDFAAFAAAARGAAVHGPIPQGPFLARLGLFQRTGVLARTQPPARASQLVAAAHRLAEPDRMGGLFKALALCHPGAPIPPGFET